jgi:hypothetical protein
VIRSLLFLSIVAAPAWAQESKPPDPLFHDDAALAVTLNAPLTTLTREKPEDDQLHGTFTYTEASGELTTFDIKLRARGHSRLDICDTPPLWLNFKKSQVKGTLLHKQDKLKLTVPCGNSPRYEQSVLREYVAYRILNEVTPLSFNVRLLHVTFVDSDGQRDERVRYAFVLEHKNRLAKRIDRKDLKIERTSVAEILPDHLNLTSIFQFMIANTDFSPIAPSPYNECCHNYVLFGDDDAETESLIVAIPYDFDQAGIVNAPYASPGEQFNLTSVRQRLYRGRCENNKYIEANLEKFRDARAGIEQIIAQQEGFSNATRKSVLKFVNDFYKIIDHPKNGPKRINNRCIEPSS